MNATAARRHALLVLAAAALFWTVILAIRLSRCDWDLRGLLFVGHEWHPIPLLADAPNQTPWGYDGQFYAELATDPFLRKPETIGALDFPHYRATRIGLPLLAWTVALGNARAAMTIYQLLCWSLGLLLVWVVARWLADDGRSPWWALPIAACAGMAASMIRCTVDAPAAALLFAAMWLRSRGLRLVLPLVTLACLMRETILIGAVALAIGEARERRWKRAAALVLVPLITLGAWVLYLRTHLPVPRVAPPGLGLPFEWALSRLAQPMPPQEKLGLLSLLMSIVGAAVVLSGRRPLGAPEAAYLGFVALVSVLSITVYEEVWAYGRALLPLPVLAVPLGEQQTHAGRRWLLRGVTWMHAVTGLRMV